ncbi:MAG: glycosyltransferase family 2 protein [Gammaproteobacteria bacterium]
MTESISIVIPARNEASNLQDLLPRLMETMRSVEVIVVDDGSTDHTATVCAEHNVRLISHPYGIGNGAAVKTGARSASGDILVLMDADAQHEPEQIPRLLELMNDGFDMIVGARANTSHANGFRALANNSYNLLASLITNRRIRDLTSGFRAVRAAKFKEFLHLLPNGFSYPATITMAFLRSGYSVGYLPISVGKRAGKSHIRPVRDGVRFLLIIFKVGTLYSPLKVFAPVSAFFFLTGFSYYLYTYMTEGRFSRMSALVLACSVLILLIGLISEQITALLYAVSSKANTDRR